MSEAKKDKDKEEKSPDSNNEQEDQAQSSEQSQEQPIEEAEQENGSNAKSEQEGAKEEKVEQVSLEEFIPTANPPEKDGRVCITYGRDKIMNRQVVSLIRELGIDPIIMQDKKNSAKPFAQFVTEHPNISFVIAILSADDWVYPKNGKPGDAAMYADQQVVFHLGFWIGRLGRNRVFALYYDQRSFRWPTEHSDVIYTPLDKNAKWEEELVYRLKAGGIDPSPQQE